MDYWHGHVYASRNRPISGLWASVPGAVYVDADYAKTGVWTWVVTTVPLDDKTVRRYELTWAWGPIYVRGEKTDGEERDIPRRH